MSMFVLQKSEFTKQLSSYVRVQESDALWPLVKYVEVAVPESELLPVGITFVDIPGTGDFNSKRDEMWKEASFLFSYRAVKKCYNYGYWNQLKWYRI